MARKRRFNSIKYKTWRSKVYKRDRFQCCWPGCRLKKGLNVHHIIRWIDRVELRFNVGNGVTLCQKHHKLVTGQEDHYAGFLSGLIRKYK